MSRTALLLLALPALAAGLAGCAPLTRAAPAGAVGIAGRWQLDPAQVDAFDARLDQYLEAHRKRMREMRRRYGGEGGEMPADGGGMGGQGRMDNGREPPPLMIMPEEPARERARYAEDLRPPAQLEIRLADGAVDLSGDAEPVRHMVPGEQRNRIDKAGSAEVECGWEGEAFVVRVRYTHKGQRSWRYERERATGLLRVDFNDTDPEYGRFDLRLHYRPAGA